MSNTAKFTSTYSGFNEDWVNKRPNPPIKRKSGYVEIDIREDFEWMSNNPYFVKKNRYLEHRYVMEKHLGRYLEKGNVETVHHKNGKKSDNRIENLELWVGNHPQGVRFKDKVEQNLPLVIEKLKEMGYIITKDNNEK